MSTGGPGALLLAKQLQELKKNPIEGFSAGLVDEGNLFKWEITIIGQPDTPYEGGFFACLMDFPRDFPNNPPTLRFTSEFFHPNVYEDGKVCISILHPPGEDTYGYESAGERWLPIHSVSSVLISVISMINDPNCDSPANVEAAKLYREDRTAYDKRCRRVVRKSIGD